MLRLKVPINSNVSLCEYEFLRFAELLNAFKLIT